MDTEYVFDPKTQKTRGAPVEVKKPVFRGVQAPSHLRLGPQKFTNEPFAISPKSDSYDIDDRLPALPYPWQVCSSNTFTCTNYSKSTRELRDQLEDIIRRSPADVLPTNDWQFNAVFYPQEVKTTFTVSFFADDSGPKNSCLVEMHLTEGDRAAFQNLVSYARSVANLKYAFADKLGFGDEDDEELDSWNTGSAYEHTSFGPIPLPSSLLLKMQADATPDDGPNCLVEMFLENACSPYADVRRTGWQELANSSKEVNFAKALVTVVVNDKDCVAIAIDELKTEETCSLITDTRRCVVKTLLNIAKVGNVEACKKMCILKPEILEIASGKNGSHSTEIQCSAVQLMHHLVGHSKSVQEDFVATLTSRAKGSCRVSNFARQALRSIKPT